MPGQTLRLRAEFRCDASTDGSVSMQRVQVHEDEYARESPEVHEDVVTQDRAERRHHPPRASPHRAHAGNLSGALISAYLARLEVRSCSQAMSRLFGDGRLVILPVY